MNPARHPTKLGEIRRLPTDLPKGKKRQRGASGRLRGGPARRDALPAGRPTPSMAGPRPGPVTTLKPGETRRSNAAPFRFSASTSYVTCPGRCPACLAATAARGGLASRLHCWERSPRVPQKRSRGRLVRLGSAQTDAGREVREDHCFNLAPF